MMRWNLILSSLLIGIVQAATVPVSLQPGDTAAVSCVSDVLTLDSSTATTATLSCTQLSPFAGIDATGATDVTGPLNAVLAALPNGTSATFPPNGQYRIEGTAVLADKAGITIDGNGSTFFATTNGTGTAAQIRVRSHWRLQRDHDTTLRNLTVIGSSNSTGPNGTYLPSLEAQHGINVNGSTNVLVEQVHVSGVWGDLVNIEAAPGPIRSTDVVVQDSTLIGASRQGLAITDAERVTIQRNTIDMAKRSLIDLETGSAGNKLTFINILNNELGWAANATIANAGANSDEHDFVIDNNHFKDSPLYPFRITIGIPTPPRRYNMTITNNIGHMAGKQNEPFAVFKYTDDVVVSGNTASHSMLGWPLWGGGPPGMVMMVCATGTTTGNTWTKNANVPDRVDRCP